MNERTRRPYNRDSPEWWGIEPDGRPDEKKLSALVEAAVEIVRPQRIILFGSAVRGEMVEDRDFDLLIVADVEDRRQAIRRIRNARPRHCPPLDIIIATPEEVEWNRDDTGCFIHDAVREGRVVYTLQPADGANPPQQRRPHDGRATDGTVSRLNALSGRRTSG